MSRWLSFDRKEALHCTRTDRDAFGGRPAKPFSNSGRPVWSHSDSRRFWGPAEGSVPRGPLDDFGLRKAELFGPSNLRADRVERESGVFRRRGGLDFGRGLGELDHNDDRTGKRPYRKQSCHAVFADPVRTEDGGRTDSLSTRGPGLEAGEVPQGLVRDRGGPRPACRTAVRE